MNYKINRIDEDVEGIESFNIIGTKNKSQVLVGISVIDTTNDNEELINSLGIIRGDCYQLAKNIVPKIITIFNWNDDSFIPDSLALVEQYKNDNGLNKDNCVVFFICGTEFIKGRNIKLLGDVINCGYETADHISDLENNHVLIQTSRNNHKNMCRQYFELNSKF